MTNTSSESGFYDVIIVGLGPTGATLANLLGKMGIQVLVIEKEAQAYHLPRAVHFDDEVMRIFQSIGLADQISEKIRVNVGMRFVDREGELLLDWPRSQEITPNGWHASYRFHQPDIEDILRAGLCRYSNVSVRTEAEVTQIEDNGLFVSISYSAGQKHVSVKANFVVGCDGANSLVRRNMGTKMLDLGFQERWLVIDAILKRPRPDLVDHTVQHCIPERPSTYARSPGDRRRWEITVLDHEDPEEICKPDSVWKHLDKWITPEDADLERTAVYTFYSKLADTWRKGRLIIAGDAAHLTPPFMGQGMCAGIRDASNLAWKLAFSVKNNEHSHTLLDSYQSERFPHAKAYIETAIRLGQLINTMDSEQALKAAFEQSDGTVRMESIKPPLGDGLNSCYSALEKHLSPQLKLNDDEMLDDTFAYKFLLLMDSKQITLTDGIEETITRNDIQILKSSDELSVKNFLNNYGSSSALIRPDRYVLGTANDNVELSRLIKALRFF